MEPERKVLDEKKKKRFTEEFMQLCNEYPKDVITLRAAIIFEEFQDFIWDICSRLYAKTNQWIKPAKGMILYAAAKTTGKQTSYRKIMDPYLGDGWATLRKYNDEVGELVSYVLENFLIAVEFEDTSDFVDMKDHLVECGFATDNETAQEYFVYVLVDAALHSDFFGSIFYVGKGKGRRYLQHNKEAENCDELEEEKKKKLAKILSLVDGYYSIPVFCNLSNNMSLTLEGLLIRALRNKRVPLTNVLAGHQIRGLHNEMCYYDPVMLACRANFEAINPTSRQLIIASNASDDS